MRILISISLPPVASSHALLMTPNCADTQCTKLVVTKLNGGGDQEGIIGGRQVSSRCCCVESINHAYVTVSQPWHKGKEPHSAPQTQSGILSQSLQNYA